MIATKDRTMIAPSILSADFSEMASILPELLDAGADLIHCDVMDGHFVPNITFGPKFIKDIRKKTPLPLDVHLMISRPEKYIDDFIDAGADYITFHYESNADVRSLFDKIRKAGVKCGLVISPDTDVSVVKPYCLDCDIILLMSVYPGFGGQKFIENSFARLKELVRIVRGAGSEALIEIDGGINFLNAAEIKRCGAEVLVAGNTVFSAADLKKAIGDLRSICLNQNSNSIV